MPYPRELKLDEETEKALKAYLSLEISNHLSERRESIDELKSHQRDYWAPASQQQGKFPFVGASRIIIPLTAIAVEAVHARNMTTLFGTKPFVSLKFRGIGSDVEDAAEEWVNYLLTKEIDAERSVNDGVLELEKFGTGAAKSGYARLTRKAVRFNDTLGKEEEIVVVIKDGATLDHVPLANFIMPHNNLDPQMARWCGEIHTHDEKSILKMEQSGMFVAGTHEKLKFALQPANASAEGTQDFKVQQEKLEKATSIWPNLVQWYEMWLSYDVDKDGVDEEIVVHYSRDVDTIMSIRYNWYEDLHRPYRIGQYMTVESRWRGIGICKQSEQPQRIVTTLHRQRLDAGTIANMRMFKIHKMSGYGPNEPIFPGKMWFLDDMTHIESIQTNEVYTSAFSNEQAVILYHQQRVGVNELTLGMPQAGTPGTATGDTLRLQEGTRKYDMVLGNVKRWLDQLYIDVVCNVKQFGSQYMFEYAQVVEDGALIAQLLAQVPMKVLRQSILFDLASVGQQRNKMTDRQNWVQLSQMIQQYYTGAVQLVQMTGNPTLLQMVALKGLSASTEAMKQILETYDVRNVDRITLDSLIKAIQQSFGGESGMRPQLAPGELAQPTPTGPTPPPSATQPAAA